MFEWLKFWSSRMEVFAVVLIPGILALLFFLMPFLDRKLERRPWRRPIPLLSVAIVLVGMIFLGFKSHLDDLQRSQRRSPTRVPGKTGRGLHQGSIRTAAWNPPAGQSLSSGPASPLVAKGKESSIPKGVPDAMEHRVLERPRLQALSASRPSILCPRSQSCFTTQTLRCSPAICRRSICPRRKWRRSSVIWAAWVTVAEAHCRATLLRPTRQHRATGHPPPAMSSKANMPEELRPQPSPLPLLAKRSFRRKAVPGVMERRAPELEKYRLWPA